MSDGPLEVSDIDRLAELDEAIRRGDLPGIAAQAPGIESVEDGRNVLLRLEQRWPRKAGPFDPGGPDPLPTIGPYAIERELGRGGFGVVFLAQDRRTGGYVALKVPRPEMLLNEEVRRRFLTEASAIAGLSHPAIVPMHEIGEAGPVCYLASTFVPGPSLAEAIAQGDLRCNPRQSALLIQQLAGAVAHVHERGLLHRDLKPSNVLLWPQEVAAGELGDSIRYRPMLTDFGLAKFVEMSLQDTQSSLLLGTPLYMAPEQAGCRHQDVGPWTDVYALGAMLYELLTGKPPFAGEGLIAVLNRVRSEAVTPPSALNPGIPIALERICLKCLAKEPADRYATALALEEDLQRFLRGEPIEARPMRLFRRLSLWIRRPERMRDAGMLTIALNAGVILWMVGMAVGVHAIPGWRRAATADFRLQVALVVVLLHAPQLWLGWQTIERKWWAIVAGSLFAVAQLAIAVGALVQGESPFEAMYPDSLAMFNSFWLLIQLFSAEVLLYLFAIAARLHWDRNR